MRRRMRTVRSFCLAGVLPLALLTVARPAFAGNAAAAEALFNQARAAMTAKDYDTACQRFAESNRLDPAVGTLLNMGTCETARGRVATAWELFRAAYEKVAPGDPRREFAKKHADELEPRLPKLTLTLASGAPPDTAAEEGDASYSGAALGVALPIDPGKHTLIVTATGHEPRSMDVELREGQEQSLEIAPGAALETTATTPGATPPSEGEGEHGAKRKDTRTLGWILGGVGVAGLGVGAITGGLALGKKGITDDECTAATRTCTGRGRDAASAGRTLAAVSTVGWIAGVLGVGAGAYFILTSGPRGEKTALVTEMGKAGTFVSVNRTF